MSDDEWGNIELPGIGDKKLHETNWNKKQNRATRKKIRDASKERWQDPVYKKETGASISKAFSTPEGRAVQASKSKPHTQEAIEKIRQANLGLVHSKERVEKNSQQAIGNQRRCKPLKTPSGAFASKKLAEDWATENGVGNANGKIGKWLKTKPEEFYYISKEEYEKIKDNPKLVDLPWMKKQKRTRLQKNNLF